MEAGERIRELKARSMGTSLDSIRALLRALDEPQDRVPSVLVAGTNGKGSTCAMLASMLRAADYRVGLFHSPSLGEDREQIRVDDEAPSFDDFERHLHRIAETAEGIGADRLTYFEALTAVAFTVFAERTPDLAIVEVGMGGARDCTNVVSRPLASALVSVGLDHRQFLGDSLAEIATEKAGIFRAERPAILGLLEPSAEAAARRVARRVGAQVQSVSQRILAAEARSLGPDRQQLFVRTALRDYRSTLGLAGAHQAENARVAILLAEALAESGFERLDGPAIEHGLESCRWPGRLEWIDNPAGRPKILLDAAHNPDGARALASYLRSQSLRPDLLFGVFRDKEIVPIFEILEPLVGRVWLTQTEHSRSMPADELDALLDCQRGRPVPELEQALREALNPPPNGEQPLLLVAGSVDLVARARARLLQ